MDHYRTSNDWLAHLPIWLVLLVTLALLSYSAFAWVYEVLDRVGRIVAGPLA